MHATADIARPVMDTREGRAAKSGVLAAATRQCAVRGSYRCTCCRGRCEVEVEYDAAGQVVHSKGQCRTPGCIAWEE